MPQQKILITTSTFPTLLNNDHTPPFVCELAKEVAKNKNWQIIILTPYIKNTKTLEERDGLKIYRFKYFFTSLCDGAILANLQKNKLLWLQVPFFFFFYLIALIKIIKQEQIKVIHAHWLIPQGLVAGVYKKFFNKQIKIICTAHGSDLLSLKNIFYQALQKFVINQTDHLTTVSAELKNKALAIASAKKPISVIPIGTDSDKFNARYFSQQLVDQYGDFLLNVNRLSSEKNISSLIDAMPIIASKYPKIKLLIIGDGPLEQALKQQVTNLKLTDNIIFLGGINHDDLPPFFATAKIFILPSQSEGFGLVLVEALLSQTPVIASDLPSISDIIINQKTGLQIDTTNSQLLAKTIINLLANETLQQQLKNNGYEYAKENFTLNISGEKYEKLYNKINLKS